MSAWDVIKVALFVAYAALGLGCMIAVMVRGPW